MASRPKDAYPAQRTYSESERLRAQHLLFKTFAGHVLAPLDLAAPNLHILDSGTADGFWLVDLAQHLGPNAQLVGSDLAPYDSNVDHPPNYSFVVQNLRDEWPAHMSGRFDLVHQRFVLANIAERAAAVAAVRRLIHLVKPGGWIQLDEGKTMPGPFADSDPPVDTVWKVVGNFMLKVGMDPCPSDRAAALLEEAGAGGLLGPIQIQTSPVKVGKGAPTPEVADAGVTNIMGIIDVVKPNLSKMSDPPLSSDEFEALRPRCIEQLNTVGSESVYVSVWAQRLP